MTAQSHSRKFQYECLEVIQMPHFDLCFTNTQIENSLSLTILRSKYIYANTDFVDAHTDFCQSVGDAFTVKKILFTFRVNRAWFQVPDPFIGDKSIPYGHIFEVPLICLLF